MGGCFSKKDYTPKLLDQEKVEFKETQGQDMTKEEIEVIQAKFNELPQVELTAQEIQQFLKANYIQMPLNTIKAIIVLSDENGDMKINKKEFKRAIQYIAKAHSLAEALFHIADADNSMMVSRQEMMVFKNKMGWDIQVSKESYSLAEFTSMVGRFLVD